MSHLENNRSPNRRDFLRILTVLGGAGVVTSFLNACARIGLVTPGVATPTGNAPAKTATATDRSEKVSTETPVMSEQEQNKPTPEPSQVKKADVVKIVLVKTADRAEGVRRAVELLGINPVNGKTVFLKPNFNSAHPAPGSTHPDVLRALVLKLQEMGANSITVGDRSGMGDTRTVMDQLGVFAMGEELGFKTLVFNELGSDGWVKHQPGGSHWRDGFLFAQPCLDCGAIVQACCLKTHQYGGVFTMSLKNSVGMAAKVNPVSGYDYMRELHSSSDQRRMIAEINTAYSPGLVVMDGVEAFRNGGPHEGERVSPELVLAGTDRVALDAAGVAVLQKFNALRDKPVFEREQIARAVELGLGVDRPEKIEFITGDTPSREYAFEIKQILMNGWS
jgi:uncharacterized protein (DUF362 family)